MAGHRPISILFGVTSPLSLLMISGQTRYFKQHGLEVIVACGEGERLDDFQTAEEVEVVRLPWKRGLSPWADLASLWRLLRFMRRKRPLVSSVGTPKAGLIGSIAGLLARVPCRIYVLHGLRYETFTGIRRAILYAADWIACRCCHRVHCVSDSVRDIAIAAGLTNPEQSMVIGDGSSNGVDITRFAPSAAREDQSLSVRRSLRIADDAPVLGFVGRLARDKGIGELLRAFRGLLQTMPQLHLLMVGLRDPVDPLDPADLDLLREHRNVICTGVVSDPETYYRIMDIFVLPTYREGFPSTVLEAQASGKPVITTTATGAVDSIVDGTTGILVPPRDVEALRGALERLLKDPATARRMGAAGRERVLRFFQQEQVWRWFLNEYREQLAARGFSLPADPAAETASVADEVVP